MSSSPLEGWPAYVARCEGACCVVGTDGNILAANGALAARVGCQPEQLQAEPLRLRGLAVASGLLPVVEHVGACSYLARDLVRQFGAAHLAVRR